MWRKENSHDLHTNVDQYGRRLAILHHKADDERGGESSHEGAAHLDPAVRGILSNTRLQIRDLGIVDINIPAGSGFDEAGNPKDLDPIVDSAREAGERVRKAVLDGDIVLSLGGNHVRGLDVIGALRACHELGIPMGLVWVDAHPDLNTPFTTDTGAAHGMVSAVLMGQGAKELLALFKDAPFLDPKNVIYVGVNDIDNNKRRKDGSEKDGTELTTLQSLERKGVRCFDMDSLKRGRDQGVVPDEVKAAIAKLNKRLKRKGGGLWVEWDVDAVDKKDMPAAVMQNNDGMSAEQIYDLFRYIGHRSSLIGMGVSEFAPKKDTAEGKSTEVVAKGVAQLMGLHDPSYQQHMHEHGFQGEDVALVAPRPRQPRKRTSLGKRVLGFAAGTAAAVGAVIAGKELLTSSHSQTADNKSVVSGGDMKARFDTQALARSWDRQAIFTGISSSNSFYPIEYSKDWITRFREYLKEYRQAKESDEQQREQWSLQRMQSAVYLGMLGAGADEEKRVALWQSVLGELGHDAMHFNDSFGSFLRNVDQVEVEHWIKMNEKTPGSV